MRARTRRPALAGLLAALALTPAPATAAVPPAPRLESLSATWVQRGTERVVQVRGEALAEPGEPRVSGSGVTLALPDPEPPPVTLEPAAGGLAPARPDLSRGRAVRIRVAPDAAPGPREIRWTTPGGVSNPLVVQVSDLPELDEGPDTALPLRLPVAVSGRIAANAETDIHRFAGKKGSPLLLEVQANRTGSPLDATLVVVGPDGQEAARSEDVLGLDPFLVFTPPSDGLYEVRLHDLRYLGGDAYRYRLVLGSVPHLAALFPYGGQRGTTVNLELDGHFLPGNGRLAIDVAPDAPVGRQEVRARAGDRFSNPLPFAVDDLPSIPEQEPAQGADPVVPVAAPAAIDGRIGTPGDADTFRFTAPSAGPWTVEVHARRFGSPLDALLTLQDAEGRVLQQNDDAGGQPDPRLEFEAAAGTAYRVVLRDLTGRGGPRFGYRLVLRPSDRTPDFTVRASAARVRVSRSGRTAVRCEVERRHGFDGIVRVTATGLPEGVDAGTLVLGPGSGPGWLVLAAGADARPGHNRLHLTATGERGGAAVERPVILPEDGWLTVLPEAPFTVDVAQSALIVEQNGTATLDVAVTRRAGFDGEVVVRAEAPEGVTVPELKLPPGTSRGTLSLRAAHNAPPGTRPVLVRAEAQVDGNPAVEHAAAAIPLTLQPIPLFLTAMLPGSTFFRTDTFRLSAVALPEGTDSAANTTEFVVKVDRRGYAGAIDLALEGLPEGVEAEVPQLPADRDLTTLRLRVGPRAATDQEHTFTVSARATHGDRIWRQKTQPVKLYIAAPEPAAEPPASAPPDAAPAPAESPAS